MYLYDAKLLHYFYKSDQAGKLDQAPAVFTGIVQTADASSVLHLQFGVEQQRIKTAKFKALGGVAVIAVCSYIAEWSLDKTIQEMLAISSKDIAIALNIPQTEYYAALLAEDAIKAAFVALPLGTAS